MLPQTEACHPSAEAARLCQAAIDFAAALPTDAPDRYHLALQHAQQALILYALKKFGGNQSDAAHYLGLHRNTLRLKLREGRRDQEPLPTETDPADLDGDSGKTERGKAP